jgi:hypothetical protein
MSVRRNWRYKVAFAAAAVAALAILARAVGLALTAGSGRVRQMSACSAASTFPIARKIAHTFICACFFT